MVAHKCTETRRIEKLENRSEESLLKLATIEEQNKNQNKMIADIHKILVGNGRPGLVDEINQFKGAYRASMWIIGTALTILTIAISIVSATG